MIKIGNEKLFSQTELLENLAAYLYYVSPDDLKHGANDFELSAIAAVIGESADFVRGFVTSRKRGKVMIRIISKENMGHTTRFRLSNNRESICHPNES